MAHDLAAVLQSVEQLTAVRQSLEKLAAGQEQMAREIAKLQAAGQDIPGAGYRCPHLRVFPCGRLNLHLKRQHRRHRHLRRQRRRSRPRCRNRHHGGQCRCAERHIGLVRNSAILAT